MRRVALGRITGAHGLDGEVRLKPFTDRLADYRDVYVDDRALTLVAVRSGGAIARLAGIDDRDAAEALRGRELWVPRAALPAVADGEYYHVDLVGAPCVSTEGRAVGRVVAVENFGAGDVLEIATDNGGSFMLPMRPEAVPECSAQRLVVDLAWRA